jgi:hypothetical protein
MSCVDQKHSRTVLFVAQELSVLKLIQTSDSRVELPNEWNKVITEEVFHTELKRRHLRCHNACPALLVPWDCLMDFEAVHLQSEYILLQLLQGEGVYRQGYPSLGTPRGIAVTSCVLYSGPLLGPNLWLNLSAD